VFTLKEVPQQILEKLLKFVGCGDLKFSGADSYNNKADWQQP